ncbi:MAG: hypothetical protein QW688_04505 [Thermoprotei archaeon]
MVRTNVAAEYDLVQELSQEAKRQNKTMYAILNEAIRFYLDIVKVERSPVEALKILRAFDIMNALEAVPIPKILLDESLQLASKTSKEELCRLWHAQGRVVGELIKTIAPTVEGLRDLIKAYRGLLPLNLFELESGEHTVSIVMTGTGYSALSSECTAEALKGLLETYGLTVDGAEAANGFVKVSAHQPK